MTYSQLKQPNLDPYMYDDNGKLLLNWSGWCLNYVRTAFGVETKIPRAIWSWERSQYRHADWDIPGGVYVPIFFSGYFGYGHAAIYRDGKVWSSPLAAKATPDVWNSIQEVERRYGVTYVGWTEDVNGELVLKNEEDEMPIPDLDNYYWRYGQKLASQIRGRQLSREEFQQHLVGQTDLRAIEILSDDPEADAAQHAQEVGQLALQDNWQQQIYDLQKALQDTRVALLNEQNKPAKEVVKEVEKIVYTTDTTTAAAVQENLKLTKSIKGMLANFIGYVKTKLGR